MPLGAGQGKHPLQLRRGYPALHVTGQRPPIPDSNVEPPVRKTLDKSFSTKSSSTPATPHDVGSTSENRPIMRRSFSADDVFQRKRLVVVSNRLPDPNKSAAGGLVAALGEMMKNNEGLWFGWSNNVNDGQDVGKIHKAQYGRTTLASIDLSQHDHDHYYAGFANAVLWPVFHNQVDKAEFNDEFFESYAQVNKMFASKLAPMLKEDDVIWVHDYHLIPLAEALRNLGCKQSIGFFNHIPFPTPDSLVQIPQHPQLMRSFSAYNLVGMQVENDVNKFHQYVELSTNRKQADNQLAEAFGKKMRIQHFPIGIDVEQFKAGASKADLDDKSKAVMQRVRKEHSKRTLMVSADRLDYTKGLPERLMAFEKMLEQHPECRNHVTLAQIASPSRESVEAYKETSAKVKALVDCINDKYGSGDWTPVIHISETVDRKAMPEFFSLGRVGLVTSVADGMNLVAKEYVAAQNPEDPGVLVLSKGAGASEQLKTALLVDPKDTEDMADKLYSSINMPLDERRAHHAPLQKNVDEENLQKWSGDYLDTLFEVAASEQASADDISVSESEPKSLEHTPGNKKTTMPVIDPR